MKSDMSVKIGKLKLKNPVMAASGTYGMEYAELSGIDTFGAVVTKTITLKGRAGNPPPRVAETASGMLNSIGLENKGLEDFIINKLPLYDRFKGAVIVSISGDNESEFAKLASALGSIRRVDALELNLSCPNLMRGAEKGTGIIAQDEKAVYKIVKAVRRAAPITVIAKLSPNVTDMGNVASSAEAGGADSISLVNTFLGMAVDIDTKKPKLGNITGGLSGPAIKPIALRMVWEAYKAVDIPVIGMGGIMDWRDAVEFIICGASAVQVGTANFVDTAAAGGIVRGIENYLSKNKIGGIKRLAGTLRLG
ncbi:MAG: dihydroorotate dehydrogenase [Candidatus Omnitrophota bacterium]|nr:dihydroorotate dehydrogenase [Candidatus Omnitrophota bacterium]